jgi:protein gp37
MSLFADVHAPQVAELAYALGGEVYMAEKTEIAWTDATWNPVRGCTQVSPGCAHCYAKTFAERFRGVPGHPFEQGFDLLLVPHKLALPLAWREPKLIFVNSMSDLFHENIPLSYIQQVFEVMRRAHWHTFQILTKRHLRLAELAPRLEWTPNIWQGVSIENNRWTVRADALRQVPAAVRFLSCEPLLGRLDKLDLSGIHWVIGGGESGYRHRPFREDWACELRDRVKAAGIPFFWKQNGGRYASQGGNQLDGREWQEWPARAAC